jgi:hypothetical protein
MIDHKLQVLLMVLGPCEVGFHRGANLLDHMHATHNRPDLPLHISPPLGALQVYVECFPAASYLCPTGRGVRIPTDFGIIML